MTTKDSAWLTDELGVPAEVKEEIELSGTVEARVLISGAAGFHANRLAELIHGSGPRAGGPFVAVRCADLAAARLVALLEQADEGTMFLEDIVALPEPIQVQLVRFLESGTLGPQGGRRLNVRIIASSGGDLWRNVACGRFRADLYYRLNVVHIVVPPVVSA